VGSTATMYQLRLLRSGNFDTTSVQLCNMSSPVLYSRIKHLVSVVYTPIKNIEGKVVPVLNEAPRHDDVLGEWRYSFTHH
jgi:hypothetical protein